MPIDGSREVTHHQAMKTTVSPFHEMLVLVKVVEAGSFTAAAEALELPKSSVSRRVTSLEERLGVRLLHRTTRSLRLTTAGEAYFDTASRLLRELDNLESLVSGFAEEPRGVLRLTCPAGFASVNSSLFSRFVKTHPKVRLALEETDRIVDLVGEGFDIAFRGGRAPDASLSGFRLLSSERILVASPEYLQGRAKPKNLKDLIEHELLHLGPRQKDRWLLFRGRRESELEVMASFTTNNIRTLQEAALSGMGIALVPSINCGGRLESGELLHLLPEWKGTPADLWLVYPSRRGLSSAVRAFIDMTREWPIFEL